jgi:uncharacterized protein YprB with RNaseH-like and TPR domain/predicted nuclease with RNAse H fold
MLQQTFIHIPGIGKQTERELWSHGIRSWDDVDDFAKWFGNSELRLQQRLTEGIPASREAVQNKDASHFHRLSQLGEAWRIYPEFVDQCVYLDIETTGLSSVFDKVTMVGVYDGRKYQVFVDGQNLQELPKTLSNYSVVVTYNGSNFDLRFLKLAFPELVLPPIHIDLRWVSRRLGWGGGLKAVEERLKLRRSPATQGLSGYDATVLWSQYQRGDSAALDRLIAYNTEDVVHLKAIAEISYDRLSKDTAKFLKEKIARIFTGVAELPDKPVVTASRPIRTEEQHVTKVAELLNKCKTENPRVVGIDLTGSERRATGWSLMDGATATTKCLLTDEELVRETIAAAPDLVSIDSPLSLPEGVIDPDVVGKFPIYRRCELALKRMGISVFWCLLPTMKCLTTRGMRLATELRGAGLRVIESYPGAAQDILGIPRKGASLDELKAGLHRAGIEGAFVTERVKHDEVDAITSALVGLFYLADEYIALGNASEDYLIVPRSTGMNFQKMAEVLLASGLDSLETRVAH